MSVIYLGFSLENIDIATGNTYLGSLENAQSNHSVNLKLRFDNQMGRNMIGDRGRTCLPLRDQCRNDDMCFRKFSKSG